jgi:hypothetical protein
MNYPEFNALSIISMIISVFSIFLVCYFISKISPRVLRLEKKMVDIIKSFSSLHDSIRTNRKAITKKSENIEFMEGDMDLIVDDKKATFKAIYYPKKIKKK